MRNADKTLQSADRLLRLLEPGSTTRHEFDKLLLELNQSASSIRQLTDYLEQHPEALLRGKDDE
jgi:paraquat-inducible protein B